MKLPKETGRILADKNHAVITVEGGGKGYRKTPCAECPWRKDSPIGAFPAEAYRISAKTSKDMAPTTFACHMLGAALPTTCAGFLLSTSACHNFKVRMALLKGNLDLDEVSSDVPMYESYREMAEANGVDPKDPALRGCR